MSANKYSKRTQNLGKKRSRAEKRHGIFMYKCYVVTNRISTFLYSSTTCDDAMIFKTSPATLHPHLMVSESRRLPATSVLLTTFFKKNRRPGAKLGTSFALMKISIRRSSFLLSPGWEWRMIEMSNNSMKVRVLGCK